MIAWSDEARVMVSPFSAYSALGKEPRGAEGIWLLVRRPLLWLVVIAGFVSFTTTGRWIWVHVLAAMLAWSFAPGWQALFVGLIAKRTAPERSSAEVVDLFFVGQGPWLLFVLGVAAVCGFAPNAWDAFRWMLGSGALPVWLVLTAAWSGALTWSFWRRGLGLGRGAAAGSTAAFYGLFVGTIVGWYVAMGQLLPLLMRTR